MTNITEEHKDAFSALTSGEYTNFTLFSCFVNGEPTSAIVTVNEDDGEYVITPFAVFVTEGMTITNHEGEEA